MNSAPVVTTLAAVLPIQRPNKPGDDRGEERQEDDEGNRCISRASG